MIGPETSLSSPSTKGPSSSAALGKQALLAFWRDLAQLLQERPGQWVAYHGDRQLGFASTGTELWRECLRQGLSPTEFVVRSIEPEDLDLVLEEPGSE
jgi:hypothetical protein